MLGVDQGLSGHAKRELFERIATVNEQPSAFDQRLSYSAKRDSTCIRVASVQRANTNCECEIKGRLSPAENEILNGNAAKLQATGGELRAGASHGLRNCLGGTIDGNHTPFADPVKGCTSRGAGPATNFENAHIGAKW
jgi:hypothetical protein